MFYYFKYLARTWYWRFKNRSYYSQELGLRYGRSIMHSVMLSSRHSLVTDFTHLHHDTLKSQYNAAWMHTYTNCFMCVVF